MKKFLIFLVIVGLGAGAYFYKDTLLEMYEANFGKKEAGEKSVAGDGTKPGTDKTVDSPIPPTLPETQPPKTTVPSATTEAARPGGKRYPTVNEFTDNWTKIGPSAFPREVTLLDSVPFKGSIGSSTFQAGAKVQALGFANGLVTLAPAAQSPFRAEAPLEKTSLKSDLTNQFNQWLAKRKAQDMAAEQYRQTLAARATSNTAQPSSAPAAIGPQPQPAPDGSYPIVVQSLGRSVKEITPNNIRGWTPVQLVEHEGNPYWGVIVNYMADTIFGKIDTEGMALIRQNRVEKWIYTGSKEEIH
jgi:hypothetical protein